MEKTLPNDISAEHALLGSLIIDSSKIQDVVDLVGYGDFYSAVCQEIYKGIIATYNEHKNCDIVMLSSYMERVGKIDNIGGRGFISELVSNTPTASLAGKYARIVKEMSIKRDIMYAFGDINKSAANNEDIRELFKKFQENYEKLSDSFEKNIFLNNFEEENGVKNILRQTLENREKREPGKLLGISSGYSAIDEISEGWQPGHSIIISANPSHGKSILLINFCINALKQKKHVVFFSLEMTKEQVMQRMLACLSKQRIKDYKYNNFENEYASKKAIKTMESFNLIIFDNIRTLSRMKAIMRYLKKQKKIDIMFLDYIQKIDKEGLQEYEAVSKNVAGLQDFGVEESIPLIEASQLSVENRNPKFVKGFSGKGSGTIEEVVDMGIVIHRPLDENNRKNEVFEIHIRKHRHGPTADLACFRVDESKSLITQIDNKLENVPYLIDEQ